MITACCSVAKLAPDIAPGGEEFPYSSSTFVRHVFGLDPIAAGRGDPGACVRLRLCAGQPRRRACPDAGGERARRVEIGYFITRPGHGDELRYRSALRDLFTLTTGGTRTTLVLGSADKAFA
jgi:hypothetical protein